MLVKPSDVVSIQFTTQNATTGAAANADSLPTGVLVKNGDDTAETVTVSNIATGVYKASVTIPSGYVAGDEVQLRIAATVAGVAGKAVVWGAEVDTARVSETYARIGAPAGASIAADINAVPTAAEIDTELSSNHGAGAWGSGGNGGALTLTYTLTSSVDSTPIEGALVELYAESGMVTLIDSKTTNVFGIVTFSNLVAGTYYLRRVKSGWSFTNPDSEVVA